MNRLQIGIEIVEDVIPGLLAGSAAIITKRSALHRIEDRPQLRVLAKVCFNVFHCLFLLHWG